MVYELSLPQIVPQMTSARIECVYTSVGDSLQIGTKLLDISVDLSSAFAQECPPISFYRIVARDRGIIRVQDLTPGQKIDVGEVLALIADSEETDISGPVERPLRATVAGIIHHEGMWTGTQA